MDYNVRFNLAKTAALVVGAAIISVTTSAVVASRAYVARGEQAVRSDQTISVKDSTRRRITNEGRI